MAGQPSPAMASTPTLFCQVYSNSYMCFPSKRQPSFRCEIDSSHRNYPTRRASITLPATSFRLYGAALASPDRSRRETLAVIYGREKHRMSSHPARSPSFAYDTSSGSDAPRNPPVQNSESQPLTASSCTNLQNRTTEHKKIDLRRSVNSHAFLLAHRCFALLSQKPRHRAPTRLTPHAKSKGWYLQAQILYHER
jgi:hypothetical protein